MSSEKFLETVDLSVEIRRLTKIDQILLISVDSFTCTMNVKLIIFMYSSEKNLNQGCALVT